jgi:hypothetical protein
VVLDLLDLLDHQDHRDHQEDLALVVAQALQDRLGQQVPADHPVHSDLGESLAITVQSGHLADQEVLVQAVPSDRLEIEDRTAIMDLLDLLDPEEGLASKVLLDLRAPVDHPVLQDLEGIQAVEDHLGIPAQPDHLADQDLGEGLVNLDNLAFLDKVDHQVLQVRVV